MHVGDRIRFVREMRKLLRRDLAFRLGVTESSWANWEKGRSEPRVDNLVRIAAELGVTTDFILGLEHENVARKRVAIMAQKTWDDLNEQREPPPPPGRSAEVLDFGDGGADR